VTLESLPPEMPTTAVLPPQAAIWARIQSMRPGSCSLALNSMVPRSFIVDLPPEGGVPLGIL